MIYFWSDILKTAAKVRFKFGIRVLLGIFFIHVTGESVDGLCCFVYAVAVVDSFADDPDDVVAAAKQPGVFFLELVVVMVFVVFGDFLLAFHSEGDEGVALLPFPEVEGEVEFVFIEVGDCFVCCRWGVGGVGQCFHFHVEGVCNGGGIFGEGEGGGGGGMGVAGGFQYQGISVFEELVCWGGEVFSRLCGQEVVDVADDGGVEAVSRQDFIQEGFRRGEGLKFRDVYPFFAVVSIA